MRFLYINLDRNAFASVIAQEMGEDLERGWTSVTGTEQAYYKIHWAWTLARLGARQRSLQLLQEVLEEVQGQEQQITLLASHNMGLVYQAIGQPQQALQLYEQVLPILRAMGNRAGEATTLSNMAVLLYKQLNRTQDAIRYMEQAIDILEQTGLPQNAGGHTCKQLNDVLKAMRHGASLHSQANVICWDLQV